jgi:hypothetical protein
MGVSVNAPAGSGSLNGLARWTNVFVMLSQQVLIRHARNVVADHPSERLAFRLLPVKVRHSVGMLQIILK